MDKEIFGALIQCRETQNIFYIIEAGLLSDFGVNISETMAASGESKRNVIYTLNDLRKRDLPEEINIGKFIDRKAKCF